jgi:hypothetical protein
MQLTPKNKISEKMKFGVSIAVPSVAMTTKKMKRKGSKTPTERAHK